jgi:hypothetical protein
MKRPMRILSSRILSLMLCAAAIAGVAWAVAVVTSKSVTVYTERGRYFSFSLDVDCASSVAGVNGELAYDPDLFSLPSVELGAGTAGFTVMGNETAPGRFRFVVYKSPTASIDLSKAALTFTFKAADRYNISGSQIVYSVNAAGDSNGTSYLDSIQFSPVTVYIKTGARNWSLFQ